MPPIAYIPISTLQMHSKELKNHDLQIIFRTDTIFKVQHEQNTTYVVHREEMTQILSTLLHNIWWHNMCFNTRIIASADQTTQKSLLTVSLMVPTKTHGPEV